MKYILPLLCSIACVGFGERGTMTLEQALELAREHSPGLQAARLRSEAAETQVGAAGFRKNPKLDVEVEGIEDGDFSPKEYSVRIKQELQFGGKRRKEKAVALQSAAVFSQAERERAIDLETEVRTVFIELMTQQEIDGVRSEQAELGRAFIEVAKRRLDAGGGSELDVVQAELALEEIKLAQSCCFGDLLAEQEKLAALLNVDLDELPTAAGDYYSLEKIIGVGLGENHPALLALNAQADLSRAKAEQARAADTSNVTLGAGVKYEPDEDLSTFMLSASIPLNFIKRGRVEQAAHLLRASAADAEYENARRRLQAELNSLLALYNGTLAQVDICGDRLIPKAKEACELSREGYEAGRFSWLELIAAQQNLADIRLRHIETLREAHLIRAELSQFMNQGL